MKLKVTTILALVIALLFLLCGCGNDLTAKKNINLGYEVTDCQGNTIKLKEKPKRIVSLSLGTDEIIMDLVPPERIAGLTYLADDPGVSFIADRSKVIKKKIKSNNAEEILALKPDLVIIADWWKLEILQTLRDLGLNVYVYKTPYSLNEVKDTIMEVAKVVGEEEKGKKVVKDYEGKLNKITAVVNKVPKSERKKIVALTFNGSFGSRGSLYDDMCKQAGVINALADVPKGETGLLSKEEIVRMNPDVILLPTWQMPGANVETQAKSEILEDPALQTVKAIKKQDIVEVPGRSIYCVSHYAADGVMLIAKGAYPNYFK